MMTRILKPWALLLALILLAGGLLPASAVAESEGEWKNILLLGGDSRNSQAYERTDSMLILSVHTGTREVRLTSLMRDTWVNISGHGWAKLNAANVYGGPTLTMQTIESHYGIHLDNYAMVNMWGLATIIDLVGGVDVSVSRKEVSIINQYLAHRSKVVKSASRLYESGDSVHLTGDQAMSLCQNRMQDSDYNRTERQRRVLVALARKLTGLDAAGLLAIATQMLEYVQTDMSLMELGKLALMVKDTDPETVRQLQLPVPGTFDSGMKNGTWSIRPDFGRNAELFKQVLNGELDEG